LLFYDILKLCRNSAFVAARQKLPKSGFDCYLVLDFGEIDVACLVGADLDGDIVLFFVGVVFLDFEDVIAKRAFVVQFLDVGVSEDGLLDEAVFFIAEQALPTE
jgi:hypothetical protein